MDRNQPQTIFWSDILADCCQNAMEITGGDMLSIESIWRIRIQNPTTQRLLGDIVDRRQHLQPALGQYTDIDPSSEDFFALMGTDHGKGPTRMLTSYPGLFGRRAITRARIFFHGRDPDLFWFLEKIEMDSVGLATPSEPGDGPLSRKQRRKQKKKKVLTQDKDE